MQSTGREKIDRHVPDGAVSCILCALTALVLLPCLAAQSAGQTSPSDGSPARLISYSGQIARNTLPDWVGVCGITFAIYRDQTGGPPLWLETQNVTLDKAGRYTVLLGATTHGLPADLFSSPETRWLAVQVQGQAEEPRLLFSSVPYAFKAMEADTLAGHTAADFVTVDSLQRAIQPANADSSATSVAAASTGEKAIGRSAGSVPFQPATNFIDNTSNQVLMVEQLGNGTAVSASAPNNSAIVADTSGASGAAIVANATAATGATVGLMATAQSPQGTALLVQNTGGGPLIRAGTNVTLFTLDGSGNLITSGTITSSATQQAPNLVAGTEATIGSNRGVTGQMVMIPDDLDSVHSFIGQAGKQVHFRLSRAFPDPNGAQHLLIGPYTYGMAIEYPGVLEVWAQDFSVHMNHQLGDSTAPAHFWVGDETDTGGLFMTALDNGGGDNSYTALASDRFLHTSHGSMRLQVRNPSDGFQLQWGPYGSEETRASFTNTSTATNLNLVYGPIQGIVAADSSNGGVMSVGSLTASPLVLVADGGAVAKLFPDGDVSIGNIQDSARLSVGSSGLFTVTDGGAVSAASLAANSISAVSLSTSSLALSGPLSATNVTVAGSVVSASTSTGNVNATSVTTPALSVASAAATVLTTQSFTLAGGTPIVGHISTVAPMVFSAFSPNSCQTQTAPVLGASDGDTVVLGIPNALGSVDAVTWFAWVSAADTVSVRGCNVTGTATAGPPSPVSIRVDVWKHQ
jgi:hypothetical protein